MGNKKSTLTIDNNLLIRLFELYILYFQSCAKLADQYNVSVITSADGTIVRSSNRAIIIIIKYFEISSLK